MSSSGATPVARKAYKPKTKTVRQWRSPKGAGGAMAQGGGADVGAAKANVEAEGTKMREFGFVSSNRSTFTGKYFYQTYKRALFLSELVNVHRILAQGYQLRQSLKDLQPGDSVTVAGMYVTHGQLLTVKKGGPKVLMEHQDFTASRLAGLTAAYVYENRKSFPKIECTEAKLLGLVWDNEKRENAKIFLASVSGTEHFYEQFGYFPLVCALRKMQMGKMNREMVVKIANIKNSDGDTMLKVMKQNVELTKCVWSYFPETNYGDFKHAITKLEP